jgi:hypothetical protein
MEKVFVYGMSNRIFFINNFYHTAILFLCLLNIKYLNIVVDILSMVVNDKLFAKSTNNRGNIWFFNQIFVSLWSIFEY